MQLGVIGLGRMGASMLRRLMRSRLSTLRFEVGGQAEHP